MFGGLRLAAHKQAADTPARKLGFDGLLQVSMLQHSGLPARVAVAVGDRVHAGQAIGVADTAPSAPVHAPADGVVEAIIDLRSHVPAAESVPHVVIQPDSMAEHEPVAGMTWPALDDECSTADLLQRVRDAGIVGLGGAGFPTADKLAGQRRVLILNGVECEPHIACDDRLMRERADAVLRGGRLLARICQAEDVFLALEASMHAAIASARRAILAYPDIELRVLPDRYPQGGERQLIDSLCGIEVPANGLPRDIGVLVVNVGTAAAVQEAVELGRPLTHRWVSVSGDGIARPGVFEVAIGTPVSALIEASGGYTSDRISLLLGGSMMGIALPDDDMPIGKMHNALTVLRASSAAPTTQPCIRCGACARVCPPRLLPQQLHAFDRAGQDVRLREHGLFACIECGCCDPVCPSQIPLTAQFRAAKHRLQLLELQREQADAARTRHELRQQRMLDDDESRAQRRAVRSTQKADPIQAALARARAKACGGKAPSE